MLANWRLGSLSLFLLLIGLAGCNKKEAPQASAETETPQETESPKDPATADLAPTTAPPLTSETAQAAGVSWMRAIGEQNRAKIVELAAAPFALTGKIGDDACQEDKAFDDAAALEGVATCLTGDEVLVEVVQAWDNDDRIVSAPVEERQKLSLGDLEPCERGAGWPTIPGSFVVATHLAGDGINASVCVQVATGSAGPAVRGISVEWEVLE